MLQQYAFNYVGKKCIFSTGMFDYDLITILKCVESVSMIELYLIIFDMIYMYIGYAQTKQLPEYLLFATIFETA